jgi:hypothetical protein
MRRHGRYGVTRLIGRHGEAKRPIFLQTLADCHKARSFNVYDRCRARYEGL